MSEFNELYQSDLVRYGGGISSYLKKFHYYFRKASTTSNPILRLYYRFCFSRIKEKHGIEIYYATKIGKGLYIGHPFNITINPNTVIGDNCNIHKGVLIGQTNRGEKQGVPTIGNNVWIGINAAIVGNITIGDDVLIAPNSYVNCDIPSHSVVFGNPCIIKHRDNATEGYINNTYTQGK